MSILQANKQFIRQNIAPSDQTAFYSFFQQNNPLNDFQTWEKQRVIQLVNRFNQGREREKEKEKLKEEDKKDVINAKQGEKNNYPIEFKKSMIKEGHPQSSSLLLLDEIQRQISNGETHIQPPNTNWWQSLPINLHQPTSSQLPSINLLDFQSVTHQIPARKSMSQKSQTDHNELQMSLPSLEVSRASSIQRNDSMRMQRKKMDADLKKKKQTVIDPPIYKPDKIFKTSITENVPCRTLPAPMGPTIESIRIISHQIVHRNFFLPDYVMYTIESLPMHVTCKRNFDDFHKLSAVLSKIQPGIILPYLQKSNWLAQTDIQLIKKNKGRLQKFIGELLKHPILKKQPLVYEFLTLSQHKAIKRRFQEYEKHSEPHSLQDIYSQTSTVSVSLFEAQHTFLQGMPLHFNNLEEYFDKYSDLAQTLYNHYDGVVQTFKGMKAISLKIHEELEKIESYYVVEEKSKNLDLGESMRIQQTFYHLKCRKYQQKMEALKCTFIPFLQHEINSIKCMTPVLESVISLASKYISKLQNQPQSPNHSTAVQSYMSPTCTFFKSGIWNQSKNLTVHKYHAGFLEKRMVDQIKHELNLMIKQMSKQWKKAIGGQGFMISKQSDDLITSL